MASKSRAHLWGAHVVAWSLKKLGKWSDGSRTRLGQGLTFLATRLAKRRMHIARTNLRLCFPDWTAEQIDEVAQQQMRLFVQSAVDRSRFWFGPLSVFTNNITQIDRTYYDEALAKNMPIIVLAPHFVGLDVGGVCLNAEREMVTMYQKQSNPVFDRLILEGRGRSGMAHLYSRDDGVRHLVKLLKKNYPLYYLPDMDFGRKDSIFSEFFGQTAATLTALPKLASLTQALIVPCVTRIDKDALAHGQTRYTMQFYPAWQGYPQGSEEQAVRQMNQFIEERIMEDPAQYLWMHKRFKTRPEGVASVY